MAWERVNDQWYDKAIERGPDKRSLNDRAYALMRAWLETSLKGDGKIKLKVEYGQGYDGKTNKAFCAIMCITLGDTQPIQFNVEEMRWTIEKMRYFYNSEEMLDDPIASDKRHRRDLDGFLNTLTVGADEAEKLDPKNMN